MSMLLLLLVLFESQLIVKFDYISNVFVFGYSYIQFYGDNENK